MSDALHETLRSGTLAIAASAGNLADPSKLPAPSENSSVNPIGEETLIFPCGHRGPRKFELILFGEPNIYTASDDSPGCPQCYLEMLLRESIRCAKCGLAIEPGSSVAVYNSGAQSLKHAHLGKRLETGQLLGCTRWNCCPSGAFFAGHWQGVDQGYVSAFPKARKAKTITPPASNESEARPTRALTRQESSTSFEQPAQSTPVQWRQILGQLLSRWLS